MTDSEIHIGLGPSSTSETNDTGVTTFVAVDGCRVVCQSGSLVVYINVLTGGSTSLLVVSRTRRLTVLLRRPSLGDGRRIGLGTSTSVAVGKTDPPEAFRLTGGGTSCFCQGALDGTVVFEDGGIRIAVTTRPPGRFGGSIGLDLGGVD